MNSEEDIFEAAAALPATERAAYLDVACAGQPDLRARIEALLRSHDVTGFMDVGTGAPANADEPPNWENLHSERAGDRIGRYKLIERIGEGGFGIVWLAEQLEPVTRPVALKIIKAGMDTKEVIARFEAERQALAMMDHPHIAKVFDAGATEKGHPYFVMELVKGIPITKFCAERQLSIRQQLELFGEVCSAINHAHQKGVIHRDIKPSNVMVALDGERPVPKVIDFGVAKVTEGRLTDRTVFTHFDQFIGTPAYMSPEQTAMSGLDVDTRSDIYSLGILLYELLTGTPPFDAKSLLAAGHEEMRRIIREVEPPKPSKRVREACRLTTLRTSTPQSSILNPKSPIEPDLDWIVMKAIEKERARRYETANGLALDIQRFLTDEPVSAGPPTAGYRFRKFVCRNRVALGVAAGFAVVLIFATIVSSWHAVRASKAALREKLAREATEFNSYVAHIEMAATYMDLRRLDRIRERLDACPERLRGWEWRWLNARADQSLFAIEEHTRPFSAPFSSDGKRIVTASHGNTARVWDAVTGQSLAELQGHTDRIHSSPFSPNGTRIVTGSADKTARVWDAVSGRNLAECKGHTGIIYVAAFSPDSTRIVTGSADKTARVWDAGTGQSLAELKGHAGTIRSASFNLDGTRILTGSADKTARVWDAVTGRNLAELKGHTDAVGPAKFSPDGTRIVTMSADRTSRVWDAVTGQSLAELKGHNVIVSVFTPDGSRTVTTSGDGMARLWDGETAESLAELKGHTGIVRFASFSPDGTRIVTASEDGTARVWDASSGLSLAELKGHTGIVYFAAFSPDGTRIITGSEVDGTTRVWDAAMVGGVAELKGHTGIVYSASFSRDATMIVTGSQDENARVWDATTGQSLAELKGHKGAVRTAVFSPDGTRILTASDDQTARVWDGPSGRSLFVLKGHTDTVRSADFSPDGTRIVTASYDKTARVWDASGQSLAELKGHTESVRCAVFSPDGTRIVTASGDKTARVWNSASGEYLANLKGHTDSIRCAVFSPDGTKILTGSGDRTARIWDAATGQSLVELKGHTDPVRSAVFSPDGTRIVTASDDKTIRVWDAATGRSLLELRGHTRAVNSAAFSLDATRMVTASDDGYARIWDSVPYRERFAAIQRMREAEKRMSPRVDACLKAGVSIEDVAVAIQADYALTPDEGTAALILLQRARDARKSAEQRAAQDPK